MKGVFWAILAAAGLTLGGVSLRGFAAPRHVHAAAASTPKQAVQLRRSIDRYKAQLARQGKYACCIRPSCDYCATHEGMCPCDKQVAANKPVCRECKGGWDAGEGEARGKTAAEIKVERAM